MAYVFSREKKKNRTSQGTLNNMKIVIQLSETIKEFCLDWMSVRLPLACNSCDLFWGLRGSYTDKAFETSLSNKRQ